MRQERLFPSSSLKRHIYLLLVCAAATLCFAQAALAQSGRRLPKSTGPAPAPVVTSEPEMPAPAPRLSAIVVIGNLIHDTTYYRSNDVDNAIKECMKLLKESPPMTVTKGGKMDINGARERAKKETDAYVLWFEIGMKFPDMGDEFICFIDYAVLMPQTAKFLTSGRVFPGQNQQILSGAVLRIPTIPNRRPPEVEEQLEAGIRVIIARVKAKL